MARYGRGTTLVAPRLEVSGAPGDAPVAFLAFSPSGSQLAYDNIPPWGRCPPALRLVPLPVGDAPPTNIMPPSFNLCDSQPNLM